VLSNRPYVVQKRTEYQILGHLLPFNYLENPKTYGKILLNIKCVSIVPTTFFRFGKHLTSCARHALRKAYKFKRKLPVTSIRFLTKIRMLRCLFRKLSDIEFL
jgi:hypothetical protein